MSVDICLQSKRRGVVVRGSVTLPMCAKQRAGLKRTFSGIAGKLFQVVLRQIGVGGVVWGGRGGKS
jgi:hypothetical protein